MSNALSETCNPSDHHLLEHDINEAAGLLVPDRQHGAVAVVLWQGPILNHHVAQAGMQLQGRR